MAKRYYEAEFGLWVEEPDPLRKPACEAAWPEAWDHAHGPRPRCVRPEGHGGEHHETRSVVGEDRWVEYYWRDAEGTGRSEVREAEPEE